MSDIIIASYLQGALNFCVNVVVAIIILLVGRQVIKILCRFIGRFFNKSRIEESVSKFLLSLIRVLLYIILIIILCDTIGIQTTSFIAVLGSAGLAVGLALQGSLSNFAGGVIILITKPFVIGDYIISALGEGTVDKIDIFYTTLVTVDNKKVMIPNGVLADAPITNVSAFAKRRVDVTVGIAYGSDVRLARETILKILEEHPLVLNDEENVVALTELGESQVTLCVKAWTNTENYWSVLSDLNEQIESAFNEAGIEIPFNQLDVFIKNN